MYLSKSEIADLKHIRHLGRTDLLFLCREILGWSDITRKVHKPYINVLDPITKNAAGKDIITPDGTFLYIPAEETLGVALDDFIKRNYLVLGFRSSLKTTVNTIGHSIQLILNFPHIAGAVYHNTEDNAAIILKEIVDHFTINSKMAEIYPEYCIHDPAEIKTYSKSLAFTTPARFLGNTNMLPHKKEPTLSAMGLETSQAGRHFQFIKMTDVVERSNSQTPQARKKVADGITMAKNLLEDGSCFLFVEGTPYHPEDAYCRIIQREWEQIAPEKREWEMVYHPAYVIETKGKPRTYSPDEMKLPFAIAPIRMEHAPGVITKKGQRIPTWPVWRNGAVKFDNKTLESKQREDDFIFACQQLLRPADADSTIFPISKCFNKFPASAIPDLHVQLRLMTVDTAASTDANYSNDTAISCAIVSDALMRVVTHGVCGMFEDYEIIESLFNYNELFKPDILQIESTMFTQGLKGQIHEQELRRGVSLPIDWIVRPRNIAKKTRIQGALKSPMSLGRFKFSTDLSKDYVERLKMEMSGFPTSKHDDILDTLEMIASASANMASFSSERAKTRLLAEEEAERMRQELDQYRKFITCQSYPDQDELPSQSAFTNYGL